MASIFKPKTSAVSGSVPTTASLADGEMATNTADLKVYQRVGAAIKTIANYFDATNVRASVLTGLGAGTNAAIAATDSLLAALAKLQAQVTNRLDLTAGGTVSGVMTFASAFFVNRIGSAADAAIQFDSDNGTSSSLIMRKTGLLRWVFGRNVTDDFFVIGYDDAGSTGKTHLLINRITGVATFLASPELPTPAADDSSTKGATTAFVRGQLTRKTLASAFVTASTTPALVTDGTTSFSVPVVAGRTYRFELVGTYRSAATTTGMTMAVIPNGAVGTINGVARGAVNHVAIATGLEASLSILGLGVRDRITTTGVSAAGVGHYVGLDFVFTCTTDGAIEIQFASEVAASNAELDPGTTLLVRDIT